MRRAVAFLLLTMAVVTLAGCGGSRGLGAFSGCPRKLSFYAAVVPRPSRATVARRQLTVAQDPRAAELCVYDANAARGSALAAHDLLPAADARTLTLMIDARGATDQSCDGGYPALVRFRYAGGHVSTLLAAGCDPELVHGLSGVRALPDIGSAGLSGLVNPRPRGDRGIRTPRYVGRPLAATGPLISELAGAAGVQATSVVEISELFAPSAPFGEVVWQSPLASSVQDRGNAGAELIVAVNRAPSCRAAQLRGEYLNGAFGTGDHFGTIVVLDAGRASCTLTGRLALVGVDTAGRPDTNPTTIRATPPLVLSPRASGPTTTTLYASFIIGGDARDDPRSRDGLCHHETAPARWLLHVRGGTVRFPDGHAVPPAQLVYGQLRDGSGGPFFSCLGGIGVWQGIVLSQP